LCAVTISDLRLSVVKTEGITWRQIHVCN